MENRNFYSALVHLNDFYGIAMKDDMFENIALHAWDHIGNKNYRTYVYNIKIKNNMIELPCNADIIEAVLTSGESVRSMDGIYGTNLEDGNINIEQSIEGDKVISEHLYGSGAYLNYEREDNTLHFKVNDTAVTIIYKGVFVDEQGLPSLNFKEIDAIAKYCAFIHLQKQAMITKDQSTFQLASFMKQQWQFAVDDARVPIYLNQNDMDSLLNVQSSWDRKRFGISYKALR